MIKHAYIAPYTLDDHIISYVSQDKMILLPNEYLAVKGLHAKRGEGVQIACKITYVLNGSPLTKVLAILNCSTVFFHVLQLMERET